MEFKGLRNTITVANYVIKVVSHEDGEVRVVRYDIDRLNGTFNEYLDTLNLLDTLNHSNVKFVSVESGLLTITLEI